MRSIRPSTPADAPAIVALFDETGRRPNAEPQHLYWKYWQPRADWPGPRSFVLASGSELIAHTAIIPGVAAWGSRRVRMIQMIDWVARRGEAGAGVALLKYLGRQADTLLSVAGSDETRRIQPHLGFEPAGIARGYARTLYPLRLLRSDEIPLWRRWPRVARSIAWKLAAPPPGGADCEVQRLGAGDIEQIASVLPAPARGMAVLERSVELFRFVLTCPIVSMALYRVTKSGLTRGYFLLAHAPGQVRIADCWLTSDDPADWRSMILCAVAEAARDPYAVEVVSVTNDPLLAAALHACGFHARFEIPIQVRSGADKLPAAPLRVQMLDNDTAYLYFGRNEFWL